MSYKINRLKGFTVLLILALNIFVLIMNFNTVGGELGEGFATDLMRGLGLPIQEDSIKETVIVPRLDNASIESFPRHLYPTPAKLNNKITESFSHPSWGGIGFAFRKNITIDSTKVPSDLNDFPVLIDLDGDTDLFGVAQKPELTTS